MALEISTAAAESRMGLDVLSGHDRRPVSMALLKARWAGVLAHPLGLSDGGAQRTTTTTDNSHTTFLLFNHPQHSQIRQTDRDIHTDHTYDMGSFWVRGEEGAWQRPFLF